LSPSPPLPRPSPLACGCPRCPSPSSPPRRSSDLFLGFHGLRVSLLRDLVLCRKRLVSVHVILSLHVIGFGLPQRGLCGVKHPLGDRKRTRLNSSHQIISYAVFCLTTTDPGTCWER